MPPPTTEQLTGRVIGALILAGFGGAWLYLGLAASQQLHAPVTLLAGLGLLALVAAGAWVLRRARQWPAPAPAPASTAQNRRIRWGFALVNLGQWVAIVLASATLPRLKLTAYVVPTIAAIVGLHFFPLARLFHYRVYYLTGAALLLWATGCVLLAPQPEWLTQVAIGAGSILWLNAGYTLWLVRQSLRHLPPRQSA